MKNQHIEQWHLPEVGPTILPTSPVKNNKLRDIYTTAHDEGFNEGYQKGVLAAENQINSMTKRFESILNQLAEPLKNQDSQLEKEILELVMTIVKSILHHELAIKPDCIIALISDCLKLIPSVTKKLTIQLHPDDMNLIQNSSVFSNCDFKVDMASNDKLEPGGCIIKSANIEIDASIESQIAGVLNSMMGKTGE